MKIEQFKYGFRFGTTICGPKWNQKNLGDFILEERSVTASTFSFISGSYSASKSKDLAWSSFNWLICCCLDLRIDTTKHQKNGAGTQTVSVPMPYTVAFFDINKIVFLSASAICAQIVCTCTSVQRFSHFAPLMYSKYDFE